VALTVKTANDTVPIMKQFELLNFSRTGGFALCCVNDDSQLGRAIYSRVVVQRREMAVATPRHINIISFELERNEIKINPLISRQAQRIRAHF